MIFVDSNIPMYLVGADHPNKVAAQRLLERAISDGETLVTDAEVLQEILHRYVSTHRREAIRGASNALLAVVDEVYPVERADVDAARRLVIATTLSARNAIHVAIARRHRVARMMTFDRGFDAVDGLVRYAG